MGITTKSLPAEMQPYEKSNKYGIESLSDAELLAIILRNGSKDINSLELASQMLEKGSVYGGLPMLIHMSRDELMTFKGIGQVKALELKAVGELSKRIHKQRIAPSINFDSPSNVAEYYMEQLRHCDKEHVILVMLNNQMGLVKEELISVGTVNNSLVSPREVFKVACKNGAVFIILIHNHPSGNPKPSKNDLFVTKQLEEIGEILDIKLIDHIIIGDNAYTSFREKMLCNERSQ